MTAKLSDFTPALQSRLRAAMDKEDAGHRVDQKTPWRHHRATSIGFEKETKGE